MGNRTPGRLIVALLAAELACAAAWALTGNAWCCLLALAAGVGAIAAVFRSEG